MEKNSEIVKKIQLFYFIGTLLSLLVTFISVAQSITSTPYSSFGVGNSKFDFDIVLESLGGISSSYISERNEINFSNPAANKHLYYTTFNVSGKSDFYKSKFEASTFQHFNSYFSNLSIGFPISKKIAFGIGFQPYTEIGYQIMQTQIKNKLDSSISSFGEGGINSLHTIISYCITNNLNVGLRINYLFGFIDKFQEISLERTILIRKVNKIYKLSGFNFTPGIFYSRFINKNHKLNMGATIRLPSNINTQLDYLQSYSLHTEKDNKFNEKIIQQPQVYELTTHFPIDYSFGLSLRKEQNWLIGVEFSKKQLPDFYLPKDNFSFDNQSRLSFGGYIIPDFKNDKNYLSRITYRFGAYYENTGLFIFDNNWCTHQLGVNFGCGFPIEKNMKNPSMFNFGFELGQREALDSQLHQEYFANIKIGFNLSDRWFKKIVID